ncbi:MAG: O-antigen translocase [Muribaculaceae bacterium]|nr:O-antigen translocase [Muribaculaceae bacterium]
MTDSQVKKNSNIYRNILKGFSLFGSVQVLQIVVNLVRGKLVAIFLGPEGMGISALFTSASQTVQRFASLGLNLAIVKEVAAGKEDAGTLGTALGVARRLIILTSLFGALVCVFGSRWLSQTTFHNTDMGPMFMLLGVAVFLTIFYNGVLALLQGLHEVSRISKASLVSALAGLLVGVPLYWWLGYDGIVPAMVLLALTMALFYTLALRKSLRERQHQRIRFSWQSHRPIVMRLVGLGLVLMISDLIGSGCTYTLNIFLNSVGNTDTVGLYQGANSLTTQYSGMVFSALALDYFPRLSAVAHDNNEMRHVVNRQIEMVGYIVTPIVCGLILTAPLVIELLLTSKFETVTPLMRWMGLGVMLKALMFPLGYIAFAKDNKKVFLWLEGITGNLLTLGMSAIGFLLFGLIGLGYGMVADCCVCFIIYYVVNRRLYNFRLDLRAMKGMAVSVILCTITFAASFLPSVWLSYGLMGTVAVSSAAISVYLLRRRLQHDPQTVPDDNAGDA